MTNVSSRQGGFFQRSLVLWLLLPSLLFIAAIQLYPGIYTFFLSTQDIVGGQRTFVGLKNFQRVFDSAAFSESIVHTIIFLSGYVTLTLTAVFIVALVLNRKMRFSPLYITIIFVPWVLSDVIVGYVWKLFVDPGTGLLSPLVALPIFGLEGSPLLTASPAPPISPDIPFPPTPALLYLIIAAAWKALPFTTLLLLAGLQTVPSEIIESGRIDGANGRQVFRLFIFPLILPTIVVTLFNLTLGGMNGVGMIFSLTGGGPGSSTSVLSYLLYEIGFSRLEFGQAASLSVFIFMINVLLIALALRVSSSGNQEVA